MGLMYIFPVAENETERVEIIEDTVNQGKKIVLKTYGLPMIFWGYLSASLIVLATMWLASKSVIEKLLSFNDTGLSALAYLVHYTLIITPIALLAFFFYEKQIHKFKNELLVVHKIFWITVFKKTFILDQPDHFLIKHHLDSPNMAKIYNQKELKQFENKGYFELRAINGDKDYLIDRHSRKADLVKIKDILLKY